MRMLIPVFAAAALLAGCATDDEMGGGTAPTGIETGTPTSSSMDSRSGTFGEGTPTGETAPGTLDGRDLEENEKTGSSSRSRSGTGTGLGTGTGSGSTTGTGSGVAR